MLVWKACFYDSPMTKVCVSKLDISYDGTKRSTVGKLLVVSLFACGHRRVLLLAEYVRVNSGGGVACCFGPHHRKARNLEYRIDIAVGEDRSHACD